MKKVFLLATTAVFMTTANAWAADPVTVSVPALGVKAELTPLAALIHQADLNFGGIVFDPDALGDADENGYVRFVDVGHNSDTPFYFPVVKAHYGDTSRGQYTYTGSLNLNGGTFTIGGETCVLDGGNCETDHPIALGENAELDYLDVLCTATPKKCYFSGRLAVKESYLSTLESTASLNESLTITYNY